MALSIQIPYKGSDYLYGGITQGAQGLASGIEQMTAHLKKAKAMRAMAVDAMNMDPEAVDKMSLPELEGHFQAIAVKNQMAQTQSMIEDRQAQAEERRARSAELMMRNDEAQAWPQLMQNLQQQPGEGGGPNPADLMSPGAGDAGIGPGPQAPAGPTPITPDRIIAAMAKMGATNPRLGAALSRSLIPQIMGGANMQQPQSWQSPQGNPYVFMGHTLMPDRQPLDVNSMMGSAPEGYEPVQTGNNKLQYLKTAKVLPPTFHTALDKVQEDIASAQATLQQPDTAFKSPDEAKTMRGYAQKRLGSAQARGKATIDRYHSTGYITPEQKDEMYQQLGLAAATAAPAAGTAAGTGAPAQPATAAPKAGDERKGYRFKGGNPADPKNWEKIK